MNRCWRKSRNALAASPIDMAYNSPMASFLVIGPHPDDQELGMGGTIARLVEQGHAVHLVDMTTGEPTPLGTPELRLKRIRRRGENPGRASERRWA
jgi:LmbE family N-acetylglucosaminyl deacetylase